MAATSGGPSIWQTVHGYLGLLSFVYSLSSLDCIVLLGMDRAPSYLSQSKAEAILSEVRPTKVRTETLICINVFLDELLWLVLSTARSFSTDRLKVSLVKVLPTTLGKDALLEAEVELKAYWEKTGLHVLKALESAPSPSTTEFPLQAAFELLRHKCEAYSTLGELDEDADVESRLQTRMLQASSNPPNATAVAPAALYLTAVLEHICEHILGNLARVVGRDASRATAQVGDLYVALCEDDTIYGLFKTMKVQEQIDRQSKGSRPRRSKSFVRGDSSPLRATSPQPTPTGSTDNMRASADVNGGGLATTQPGHAPSSSDKLRALKMFKNGNSDAASNKEHQRSMSVMSKRTTLAFQDNEAESENGMQDFDDLMNSGTTMKVSLTPDRLKTFEIYNKQKLAKAKVTPAPPPNAEPAPPFKSLRPVASTKSIGRAQDLLEDRENATSPLSGKRNHSIATPGEVGIRVNPARRGSDSSTPPTTNPALLRKASATGPSMAPGPSSYTNSASSRRLGEPMDMSNGMPKRNRTGPRGPARNRESLDLDEVMDVDDEIAFGPPPMMPKAASASGTSSSTRDLIDFLSEGPPEQPSLPPLQTNNLNVTEKPQKSGRLRSMFSRNSARPSTEALPTMNNSASTNNVSRATNGSVSLGRSNSSLKKQRSVGNLDAPRAPPQPFPPVEYPRPPHYTRASAPPSPTLSSPQVQTPAGESASATGQSSHSQSLERARHVSVTRKAAPVWDGGNDQLPVPPVPNTPRSPGDTRPPPSPKASLSSNIATQSGHPVQFNTVASPKESQPSPSSPPTPSRRSGMVPAARSAGIPNLPAAKAVDVSDMRKKLSQATSVPEARLLVDLFLTQWGFPVNKEHELAGPLSPPVVLNGTSNDDGHGVSIVELLLGESSGSVGVPSHEGSSSSSYVQGQQTVYAQSPVSNSTDEPLTPSASQSTPRIPAPRGARIDTSKQTSPSVANGPSPVHHHRYGNTSPVVVS